MPGFNEENIRHLLRRTEVVDRPARVAHLMSLPTIEAAVDDVMNVRASPPSASFSGVENNTYHHGVRIGEHWMDQLASAPRPFAERMAFFWHGHICTEIGKTGSGPAMREQVDLFRREGLGPASNSGNVSSLVKKASVQVAMLRYLDNVENRASSPNQNFARELMELFLLGVGNYTEADVEAATAAWTGHGTPRWDVDDYVFNNDEHEKKPQAFLGKTINAGAPANAGFEMIEVILGTGPAGSGTVPGNAAVNRGRPTRDVAAEFLTKKLWQEFGEASSGGVPSRVGNAMRSALTTGNFAIRPWVKAMLVHDDFYSGEAKAGLVRQPVEFYVALMVATGMSASRAEQTWLMDGTGQKLLYPPNVSGWKPNGYWVNASAMGVRQQLVQGFLWKLQKDTWDGDDGYIQFGGDPSKRLTKTEIQGLWKNNEETKPVPTTELVDRLASYTGLRPSPATRNAILGHLDHRDVKTWMRLDALSLLLSAPEMHIA